jgi:hypothetical protein
MVQVNNYRLDNAHDLYAHTIAEIEAQADRLKTFLPGDPGWTYDALITLGNMMQLTSVLLASDAKWPSTDPWPAKAGPHDSEPEGR